MPDQAGPAAGTGKDPLDYYQGINPKVFDLIPAHCARVLEIGCASGVLGKAYKDRYPGACYVGIELFEAACRRAAQCLDRVFQADVEEFDWTRLGEEKFDCIVFADVLEHLHDPGKVLRAVSGLLRAGGCVVCCVPNIGHWSIISGLLQGKWEYADSGVLDRTHLRFFTIRTFQALLKECGFRPVAQDHWNTMPFLNDSILPLLEAMGVDPNAFEDRTATVQWVVRAERIADAAPRRAGNRKSATLVVSAAGSPALTRACLESLARAYPEAAAPRVLVMDDAAGDGTRDYLEAAAQRFPWLTNLRSASPMGASRSRNRGAGCAESDVLVFLAGNAQVTPGWLDALLDRIDDDGVGMVGSQSLYPNGTLSQAGIVLNRDAVPVPFHRFARSGDRDVDLLREMPAVSGACMMIHRKLFQEVDGFTADLPPFFADLDLCFKVRRKGHKVLCQYKSRVIHPEADEFPPAPEPDEEGNRGRLLFMRKWKDFLLEDLPKQPRFYAIGREYWHPQA